jgi:hypothetical protein
MHEEGIRTFIHAAVSNKRRIQRRKVIASHKDGDADVHALGPPHLPNADMVGVVAHVHQRAHHDLVIHCALHPLHHVASHWHDLVPNPGPSSANFYVT